MDKDTPVSQETVAAAATPPGRGGVGIVRVSGPLAKDIGRALFVPARPGFTGFTPYLMHHGHVLDAPGGSELDEVLAVFMPGPRSFTGEDVMEFHCHGGPLVVAALCRAAFACGVRPAGPGEFTRRAFMNGRMDLSQAEAVAEMIAAPSRAGLDYARARLSGLLGARVQELRAELMSLLQQLCVAVDFPEDEVECLDRAELGLAVAKAAESVAALLQGFERARPYEQGVSVVLAGEVNAGKSSLMNALLGRKRAIVADQPGTTRDYLEETAIIHGMPVRLADTAGLRETVDEVEQEGLRLGRDLAERADLVLLVKDATRPLDADEEAFAAQVGNARLLGVLNKVDLLDPGAPIHAEEALAAMGVQCFRTSARTGQGLEELTRLMRDRLMAAEQGPESGDLAPNLRQSQALAHAFDELQAMAGDLAAGLPCDLLAARLQGACAHLGEITGEMAPQEVLDAIFASFCIGK